MKSTPTPASTSDTGLRPASKRSGATVRSILWVVAVFVMLFTTIAPDMSSQRRGGSFGGSRSSGRSYSSPRSSPSGGGSFGSSRSSAPRSGSPSSSSAPRSSTSIPRNSFGGSRLNSSRDYTSQYGTPRQVQKQAVPNGAGGTSNYVVNRYGGMGDGFMMGYMMGSIPWYFSMPFHPAYYYSRPVTVANPDGTTGIYPGTFQWGTLFFTLLVVGGIGYIIYVYIRNRRRRNELGSSNMSQSSFG